MAQRHPVFGLPARIGQLAASPDAALARVDADGGGLRDVLVLVAASVVAFRLPELLQVVLAIVGQTSGAFMRLVGLCGDQARQAAWFVLPAAVAVTVLARKQRDASRDLDLAAACYPPHFVALGLERALTALAGPNELYAAVTNGLAIAAMSLLVWRAVRVARARPPAASAAAGAEATAIAPEVEPASQQGQAPQATTTPATPAAAGNGARAVGAAIVGLTLAITAVQAVWSARHIDDLRPMRSGQIAPDFSLPRIDGTPGAVAMASLRGQVVVLDFWATWCPPCVAMIPVLDDLHHAWGPRGVSFVGVNSDGGGATLDDIKAFMAAHPIGYPVVIDSGDVGARYRLQALPNLFVIGRDGRIRASFIGYTRKETLERALRDALDAAGG